MKDWKKKNLNWSTEFQEIKHRCDLSDFGIFINSQTNVIELPSQVIKK